jgi:hypothetical protein
MVNSEWFFIDTKETLTVTAVKGCLNMWPTCQAGCKTHEKCM